MIFEDQLGNCISLPHIPNRIVSLVPSQTELLFDLGLADKIVGITKFCIHPHSQVKTKTIIGGTKNFNLDVIHQLKPDLIIGNKEENFEIGILELQQQYPVYVSDIYSLEDVYSMITDIGLMTQTAAAAQTTIEKIKSGFASLPLYEAIPTAYFIWKNPYMSVGHNTFIHQMMQKTGFTNVFAGLSRYPVVQPEDLIQAQPKVILLSSEPYPFKEKHLEEFQQICPNAIIKLVDGELFSWYGSRLLYSPAYFKNLREEVENTKIKQSLN